MTTVEGLVVNGVTEILKKLVGVISDEISPFWKVKGDLKNLEKTLEMILAVISDAENRQVNENSVKLWLKRLRDVAYDADDVLDEFAYELMRRDHTKNHIMNCCKRDKVGNYLLSVCKNISFDYQMATKIKTINTNLNALAKDMASFGFNQLGSGTSISDHLQWDGQNNTDSYGDDSEINVERENDISHIVDLLIKSHDDEKVSVISIVGMGGIGKTTLAQRVYNDETVTKYFDLKIWVYVSDRDIVVDRVSKDILGSVTGSTSDTPTTDVLVRRLREKLNGKRYLLVLDDFWDKDIGKWAGLKSRLVVGAQGSKILVTTRSIEVASNIRGAISPYILQQISDEGCWSIIKHRAFSPGGARESSNMIDLGKGIASKCGGVPLAAQTLGSFMHNKNQQKDWVKIKEMPIMTILENESRIKEILKLSYDHLSPRLKQCFSYCTIFPRGWELERTTMVQLWIAEGFVPSLTKEEGKKFFNTLVNNSLLQTHPPKRYKKYKMHDLIYELAQSVSENNEFLNVKVSEMDAISNKEVRRLGVNFDVKDISTTFPKKLHTFLTIGAYDPWRSNCVFSNKYLRVLSLRHPMVTSLSFAKLKHLRYLNLSYCGLQVQDLTIGALYNLQTLLLENCWNLGGLPNGIGALKKIRHLSLYACSEVEELPMSICTLSNLQYLFLHCTKLKGLPSDIGNLKKLRILDLSSTKIDKLPDSIYNCHDLEVLNVGGCKNLSELRKELGDLKHLRVLSISQTRIQDLPDSITGLTELTKLDFRWSSLEVLPDRIGDLKLRKLNLENTKIRLLPESCTSTRGLCNLEEVNPGNCQLPKYIGNWTNLRSLTWPENCTIGTMLGMDRLTRLERLDRYDVSGSHCAAGGGGIGDLGGLNLIGGELTINCLKRVRGGGIEEAKRANLREKSYITGLTLNWQGPRSDIDDNDVDENKHLDEDVLEGLQPHSNLKIMSIDGYKGLKFPSWMTTNTSLSLPNLLELKLRNCNGIQQLRGLGQLRHLKKLTLLDMDNLEEWIEEDEASIAAESTKLSRHSCYFPMLVELVIRFCPKLITMPTNFPCLLGLTMEQVNAKLLNINNITSLHQLCIVNLPQLEFLPRQMLHPRLKSLVVKKCPDFQGFLPHIQDVDLQAIDRSCSIEIEWLHPQSDSTKKVLSKLHVRSRLRRRRIPTKLEI